MYTRENQNVMSWSSYPAGHYYHIFCRWGCHTPLDLPLTFATTPNVQTPQTHGIHKHWTPNKTRGNKRVVAKCWVKVYYSSLPMSEIFWWDHYIKKAVIILNYSIRRISCLFPYQNACMFPFMQITNHTGLVGWLMGPSLSAFSVYIDRRYTDSRLFLLCGAVRT